MAFTTVRLATLGAIALAGTALAQTEAAEAADAAEIVAQQAQDAIRAIDPTTGGPSLVVDPSLPQPYGAALGDADLPELPSAPVEYSAGLDRIAQTPAPRIAAIADFGFDTVTFGTVRSDETLDAPRGPAARMISQPLVQDVPAPAPAALAEDPFTINSILTLPPGPFRYGDWYWDETGAPTTGKLVITVDLDARVISVFRGGHEIGTAVALLGTTKHPTPLGTFPILTKEKDNVSEKYNNAPMPWTLRLTWDGIAIHGSPVQNGYASHGCVGVPDPFAEKLFAVAKRGDKVVITRGKMVDVGDRLGG